ncbi:MAG TPA: Spy/CpxP family protein refolding chaperone [Polyangiaceae bacterium]|nr:Spy/CpxP family protein refolding chaperone [Polyangiaceae bacterium]
MRSSNRLDRVSFLFALTLSLPLVACAGGEAPPAVTPPPPAPASASVAPAPAPTPAPAPAPAPVASAPAEAPPEPAKPKFSHRHPLLAVFVSSLDSLELNAEQKTAVAGIQSDLAKHAEPAKEPREKLQTDVAAGVTAGKLDQPKIDADIRALSASVAATQPALQDDLNRLHKTLTPEQRKKLVATVREKAKQMHEHGMAMHEKGMAMHEHGGPHEHGDMGCPKGAGDKGCAHEHGGMADWPGGTGDPHHPGDMGGHEHGGMGWEGPLAKLSEELSLTPEQSKKVRTKVEALVKAQQAAMKTKMAAAEKHLADVSTAFESDKFDAKKAGVGAQAPDLVSTVATERVKFVQAVLSELTAEQRPKFLAHIQAHNADME